MNEQCPNGHNIKTIPAGISKSTGKPYNSFKVCEDRNCNWKPERTFTPRPAKTEQVRQMQETKAGFIKVAQDNKNDSIRLSSAGRDATLIITTFFPKLDSPEVIRKTWLTWREWLYNRAGEIPSPDKEPFKTMNAPEKNDTYFPPERDPNWPPEEYR